MSIRLRLTLWYTAVLGATVIAFCVAIYFLVSYVLYASEKEDMRGMAQRVYDDINIRAGWSLFYGPRVVFELPELTDFGTSGYYLQVVDQKGTVLEKNIRAELPIPHELKSGGTLREPVFREGRVAPYPYRFLVYNVPILLRSEGGGTQFVGVLQVATTADSIEQTLSYLRTVLTLLGLLAIGLASSLGWFFARKALQPIEVVTMAADRIEQAADLNHRIAYDGPGDEIGRLTNTINGMLSRIQTAYGELEDAVKAQRRFVSDASHELRTPLTTIRGNVELLEKMWQRLRMEGADKFGAEEVSEPFEEAIRDIAGEAERMSRLVNDLLMLARADTGHKMRKEPLALLPLVEEVARKASHLPRKANWVLGDMSALRGATVIGNADALRQLLFIFIENAFNYTPSGEVELSAAGSGGGMAGIRIRDTGIGLDKEEIPKIFERFYRADPSRGETGGTGLGLAIAKWIVDEHEGSIEVLSRKGEGTSFVVWLPTMDGREADCTAVSDLPYNEGRKDVLSDGSR